MHTVQLARELTNLGYVGRSDSLNPKMEGRNSGGTSLESGSRVHTSQSVVKCTCTDIKDTFMQHVSKVAHSPRGRHGL